MAGHLYSLCWDFIRPVRELFFLCIIIRENCFILLAASVAAVGFVCCSYIWKMFLMPLLILFRRCFNVLHSLSCWYYCYYYRPFFFWLFILSFVFFALTTENFFCIKSHTLLKFGWVQVTTQLIIFIFLYNILLFNFFKWLVVQTPTTINQLVRLSLLPI